MKIKNLFKRPNPVISMEVFPPKSENPLETIRPALESFQDLNLDYISVTYGAGGSSRANTIEIASEIKNKYKIETMSHLTGVVCDEAGMLEITDLLEKNNIENVLALRGDFPQDYVPDPNAKPRFKYGKDLVTYLKETTDLGIAAAAYPEGHLECTDMKKNIEFLKEKVDCGVDFLVTQLFFHNDNYYDFFDKAAKAGINIPVSAGIMPILNAKQIKRITSMCGAVIPDYLMKVINKYDEKPEVIEDYGIEYASKQIQNLLGNGVKGIHLYSMNKPYAACKIINNLSLEKAI
jgi:methylenetetrahydrofolate reductase (NADPH)